MCVRRATSWLREEEEEEDKLIASTPVVLHLQCTGKTKRGWKSTQRHTRFGPNIRGGGCLRSQCLLWPCAGVVRCSKPSSNIHIHRAKRCLQHQFIIGHSVSDLGCVCVVVVVVVQTCLFRSERGREKSPQKRHTHISLLVVQHRRRQRRKRSPLSLSLSLSLSPSPTKGRLTMEQEKGGLLFIYTCVLLQVCVCVWSCPEKSGRVCVLRGGRSQDGIEGGICIIRRERQLR